MGEPTWILDIASQWPALAWLVPILLVGFWVVKFLSIAHEPVAKVFGSVGTSWRESAKKKREQAQGEMGALSSEVKSLSKRVDVLLLKDEINWAYVLYDEGWHRQHNFDLVASGEKPGKHMSFPQFRTKWLKDRGLTLGPDS